ncbi:MAG: PEP/pyruvate-binding domain-containing protein, partial [Syntrophobacteraceae bacterium]
GGSRGRIAGDFLEPTESDRISELGKKIRDHLTTLTIPEDVREAILEGLARAGMDRAYAIRSSATAEDLPTASFAGQQETYLNVIGEHALLHAIQKCWASLFTDRAIAYRAQNGFDHRSVFLSVVVQRMIFPEVSGIMFTADPVTGNRNTVSIDAGFGLGEAFVSGIVSADLYQVRDGRIIKMQIAEKKKAIYPKPGGGTLLQDIPPDLQSRQALPDAEILELAALGQRIEKHFGSEQDIEWCFAGSEFFILQSRPITSLFPKPVVDDGRFHIFLSFAHTQMMMDAMKPMAISVWQTLLPFDRKSIDSQSSFVREVGGRLFMDVTEFLHWRPLRRHITWK